MYSTVTRTCWRPGGSWNTGTLMYWFIRLFVLTDPTSPRSAIRVNEEILAQSLAIVDSMGQVIGEAFDETMPPLAVSPEFRENDPLWPPSSCGRRADCHLAGYPGCRGADGAVNLVLGILRGVCSRQGRAPSAGGPVRCACLSGYL